MTVPCFLSPTTSSTFLSGSSDAAPRTPDARHSPNEVPEAFEPRPRRRGRDRAQDAQGLLHHPARARLGGAAPGDRRRRRLLLLAGEEDAGLRGRRIAPVREAGGPRR